MILIKHKVLRITLLKTDIKLNSTSNVAHRSNDSTNPNSEVDYLIETIIIDDKGFMNLLKLKIICVG